MRRPEAPAPVDCPLHPTAANHRRRLVPKPSDTRSHLFCRAPPATVALRCYYHPIVHSRGQALSHCELCTLRLCNLH
eukprot:1919999-Pleurochrysis_carterae.AAC.1